MCYWWAFCCYYFICYFYRDCFFRWWAIVLDFFCDETNGSGRFKRRIPTTLNPLCFIIISSGKIPAIRRDNAFGATSKRCFLLHDKMQFPLENVLAFQKPNENIFSFDSHLASISANFIGSRYAKLLQIVRWEYLASKRPMKITRLWS